MYMFLNDFILNQVNYVIEAEEYIQICKHVHSF